MNRHMLHDIEFGVALLLAAVLLVLMLLIFLTPPAGQVMTI